MAAIPAASPLVWTIEARHTAIRIGGGLLCGRCEALWPCDARLLLDERVAMLRREDVLIALLRQSEAALTGVSEDGGFSDYGTPEWVIGPEQIDAVRVALAAIRAVLPED